MTAFSNGFEYDSWCSSWCGMCIKDASGEAPEGVYCSILSGVILNNEVPEEWTPGTDDLRNRYHCSKFEGVRSG